MCGIVGLFLKDKSLEPKLGQMLTDMLITMTDRGPDSAGIAIYGSETGDSHKLTVQSADPDKDFDALADELGAAINTTVRITRKDTHAVLEMPAARIEAARAELKTLRPGLRVMSAGDTIEIYKEVGLPKRRGSPLRPCTDDRHARHRPHPHGNGICRHHHGRAPVLDRARPVPGAQRLAVQPQQPAPPAGARGHLHRNRKRHRGGRRLPDLEDARRRNAGRGAGIERCRTWTASSPSSSAPGTASAWCATRSPASPP
jgi:hypothetical protein